MAKYDHNISLQTKLRRIHHTLPTFIDEVPGKAGGITEGCSEVL